jgi:hypothetical protein
MSERFFNPSFQDWQARIPNLRMRSQLIVVDG